MENDKNWSDETGYFSEESATFGDRVAAARVALGLSQQELCQKLGIKLKTLRAWEDDMAEPRANKLQMMSGVLNVSLIWLLTGEGDGLIAPRGDMEPLTSDTNAIISEIQSLHSDFSRLNERLAKLEERLRRAELT